MIELSKRVYSFIRDLRVHARTKIYVRQCMRYKGTQCGVLFKSMLCYIKATPLSTRYFLNIIENFQIKDCMKFYLKQVKYLDALKVHFPWQLTVGLI